MKNEYLKSAIDFLKATETNFKCEFIKNDFHFDSDKETRDIYKITLSRGGRKFSFNFGQSINDSGFYFTMGKQITNIDKKYLLQENKGKLISHVKLQSAYQFMNNGKSDIIHYPVAPNEYDILACLTKYDPQDFENFCSEFGYDTDSKSAEKTYNAVLKEWSGVQSLWSDNEIEMLNEIN